MFTPSSVRALLAHLQYSIERAALLAKQLRQLASRHPHQLAGHLANLDFWTSEAIDAIRALDGYNNRFHRLRDAQVAWTRRHATRVDHYCPACRGRCEFGPRAPAPPERTSSEDIEAARLGVRRAFVGFLARLYEVDLLGEREASAAAASVGAPFAPEDLEPRAD